MKKCNYCDTPVQDNANFCPNCGASSFTSDEPTSAPAAEQPSAQPNVPYQAPVQQNTQSAKPPKKNSRLVRILIGVGAALLAYCISYAATSGILSGDKPSRTDDDDETTRFTLNENNPVEKDTEKEDDLINDLFDNPVTPDIDDEPVTPDTEEQGLALSYTTGEIVNGEYINEWANIRFPVSAEWPSSDQSVYDSMRSVNVECGFASMDNANYSSFILLFENIAFAGDLDAKGYFDIALPKATRAYDNAGIGYTVSDYYELTVAGESFVAADIIATANGMSVHQTYAARVQDGYVILFNTQAATPATVTAFFNSITPVN